MVEVLGEFVGLELEGLLVMYGQRVVFHYPVTEIGSRAINDALIEREEQDATQARPGVEITRTNRAALLKIREGEAFVVVALPQSMGGPELQALGGRARDVLVGSSGV
jgi:hypothetical protein